MTPTQLSNQELLPCPFCNGEPMIKYWEEKFPDCVVQISCQNCNTKQWVAGNRPFYGKEWCLEKAYEQWNARTLSGQGNDLPAENIIVEAAKRKVVSQFVTDTPLVQKIKSFKAGVVWYHHFHTAQPAPVSVEDVVEALEKIGTKSRNRASGLWFSHQDLRECIVNLFNAK